MSISDTIPLLLVHFKAHLSTTIQYGDQRLGSVESLHRRQVLKLIGLVDSEAATSARDRRLHETSFRRDRVNLLVLNAGTHL